MCEPPGLASAQRAGADFWKRAFLPVGLLAGFTAAAAGVAAIGVTEAMTGLAAGWTAGWVETGAEALVEGLDGFMRMKV